jgi:PAS domain S-box-containing protein
MNVLLKYTLFDFSEKAHVSEAGDEIDAIALALNTLGEELEEKIRTERKYTERLEQLAVVMETTADGVITMDNDGTITHWNKSAETIFGFSSDQIIGRNFLELLGEDQFIHPVSDILTRARVGEQVRNYELTRIHKNKRQVVISLTLTPIFSADGNVNSVSAIAHDITERKRVETELRENEERFRSLVEGVKDYAIIMLDPAGLVSSWNVGARTLHGFEEREARGQHFSLFFTGDDKAGHVPTRMLKDAIRNGKSMRDCYVMVKNAPAIWANVLVTCLRDDDEKVTGFSLITRDLTETRKKDEAISLYTHTLEGKNLELERINRELSSFTYVSSHDLQEPLRKIRTLTSRLVETELTNLSENGREYFRRMESSAARMQQLIRDIINYSSLTSSENLCEVCDLNELMDEVLAKLSADIKEKNAKIEVESLCHVNVIRQQFIMLMGHIIGNSLKFTKENQAPVITVKSHVEKNAVSTSGGEDPRGPAYCVIEVSDNGIGFEEHFNLKVFEVFQRLHTQDNYSGTGIGLAICKKIVENHQGTIEARSELGKGTTITVRLPLAANDAPQAQ